MASNRKARKAPSRKSKPATDNTAEREQLRRIHDALCDANTLFHELAQDYERVPGSVRIAADHMNTETSEALEDIDDLMHAAGCFNEPEQEAEAAHV